MRKMLFEYFLKRFLIIQRAWDNNFQHFITLLFCSKSHLTHSNNKKTDKERHNKRKRKEFFTNCHSYGHSKEDKPNVPCLFYRISKSNKRECTKKCKRFCDIISNNKHDHRNNNTKYNCCLDK